MKKLLITTILTLAATSALAQKTVMGTGSASSLGAPACDDDSYVSAQQAADFDAAKQCQGKAERSGPYAMSCNQIAHGYAANAIASAQYTCSSETMIDAASTIDLNTAKTEEVLHIAYPTMQHICGIAFQTSEDGNSEFAAILAHLRFELVRSGMDDLVPGELKAFDHGVTLSFGSFQANHMVTVKVTSTDGKALSIGLPLYAFPVPCAH